MCELDQRHQLSQLPAPTGAADGERQNREKFCRLRKNVANPFALEFTGPLFVLSLIAGKFHWCTLEQNNLLQPIGPFC